MEQRIEQQIVAGEHREALQKLAETLTQQIETIKGTVVSQIEAMQGQPGEGGVWTVTW